MKQTQIEILANWSSSWLEQQRGTALIPGIAYTIFTPETILVKEGLGYLELENGSKVDPMTSLFRLASISKSVTALGIAKLLQQGKISLDDHLDKFLQIKSLAGISLSSILSHTSGLIRDGQMPFWINDVFPDGNDLLEEARLKDIQVFKQGKKYKYSNFAYALLGLVIEKITGLSFNEYIKKEIFKPLGLKQIFTDSSQLKRMDKLAQGYERVLPQGDLKIKREKTSVIDSLAYAPAVGFISSAYDLTKLLQQLFLRNDRIVDTRIKQILFKTRKVEKYPTDVYSLGFKVWKSGKNLLLGHGGSYAGFRGYYALCPKHAVGALVLTNSMNDRAKDMVENLIAMQIKIKAVGGGGNQRRYKAFEGMFTNRWGDYQVLALGDALYYYDMNSLQPVSDLIKIDGNPLDGFFDNNAGGGDYKGERVEFTFTNRGGMKQLKIGSSIMYPKYWK